MKPQKHLFIIDMEAWKATSLDEVAATISGLKEVGLYQLPYDSVAVRMPTSAATTLPASSLIDETMIRQFGFQRLADGRWKSALPEGHYVEIRNVNLRGEAASMWLVHEGEDPKFGPYEIDETAAMDGKRDGRDRNDMPHIMRTTADLLITLLATRNAVKTTVHHKAAKLGIGGKKPGSTRKYEYVTTISCPAAEEMEDDAEHAPTGAKRKAHLRRGHVRRQHYGPKNAFVKLKWIAPVFVNADPEFVSQRKAYNLTMRSTTED